MFHSRSLSYLCLLSSCLVLSACAGWAPPEPAVDFRPGYDFAEVEKVAIRMGGSAEGSSELLGEEVLARFGEAVRGEMQTRGFQMADDESSADLVLRWTVTVQEKTEVRTHDNKSYYVCWRCGPSILSVSREEYIQGTVIVDFLDPELGQSVWRGVVQDRIYPELNPEERNAKIDRITAHLLEDFPPP